MLELETLFMLVNAVLYENGPKFCLYEYGPSMALNFVYTSTARVWPQTMGIAPFKSIFEKIFKF